MLHKKKTAFVMTCLITLASKVNRKLHSYSLLAQCDILPSETEHSCNDEKEQDLITFIRN